MAAYNGPMSLTKRELSAMVADKKYGPAGTAATLIEGLKRNHIKPEDFRIRHLFESLVPGGSEIILDGTTGDGQFSSETKQLLESGAVTASQFAKITGQIVYNKTLERYQDEEFVFTKLVEKINTPGNLDMEKVAGIGRVGNQTAVVQEKFPYPSAGPVSDYIHMPAPKKRGQKVALTWESVFSDRTGQLLQEAADVGYGLGYDLETRIIDAIVDENAGAVSAAQGGHRYHWRDTSYATFQTSTPYINVKTSNALVDWTDVQGAELILSAITDPNTGLPVMINPTHIIVTKQLEYTARYVVTSGAMAINAGGYATSGTPTRYELPNFLPKYQIATSRILETRMATDTDWYLCNPKAWGYRVVLPLEVTQAPANHPDEFDRDIVQQWRAREFGAAFVRDPRLVCESRA